MSVALLRMLFIRATHSIWLSALNCSVTPSRSAICFTSRKTEVRPIVFSSKLLPSKRAFFWFQYTDLETFWILLHWLNLFQTVIPANIRFHYILLMQFQIWKWSLLVLAHIALRVCLHRPMCRFWAVGWAKRLLLYFLLTVCKEKWYLWQMLLIYLSKYCLL